MVVVRWGMMLVSMTMVVTMVMIMMTSSPEGKWPRANLPPPHATAHPSFSGKQNEYCVHVTFCSLWFYPIIWIIRTLIKYVYFFPVEKEKNQNKAAYRFFLLDATQRFVFISDAKCWPLQGKWIFSLSLPTASQVISFLCSIPHPSYDSDSVIVHGTCKTKENIPFKKRTKDLNRYISKEDIQMAIKYMK